jgi:hypothetical protein
LLQVLGKVAGLTTRFAFNQVKGGVSKSYRRKSPWPMILILAQPVLLIFLLWALFSPTQGEENDITLDAFLTKGSEYSTSKGDFKSSREKSRDDSVVKQIDARNFPAVTMAGMSFNPATTDMVKVLNMQVYTITHKYFNKDVVKNIPGEWADPLIIMALANVESGEYQNANQIWTSAIPNKLYQNITPDFLSTFGIADALKNPAYWKVNKHSADRIQGPLQMTPEYGVQEAIIPEDLQGTEQTRSTMSLADIYPSTDKSQLFPMYSTKTGDRFNWPDAANRTAGKMDVLYKSYMSNSGINKTGDYEISNRYSMAALIAIGHNTGESVFTQGDKDSAGNWPNASVPRRFASVLGKPDVLAKIKEYSDATVTLYRSGGDLYGRATLECLDATYKYIYDKGYFTEAELRSSNGENKDYPIHVLYSYLLLEKLYQGG